MAFLLSAGPVETPAINSNGDTVVIVLPGVDAGDLIVVGIYWISATASVSSVSCSGESNLTLLTPEVANSSRVRLAYFLAASTGGEKTITVTFSETGTFARGGWAAAFDPPSGTAALTDDDESREEPSGTSLILQLTTLAAGELTVGQVHWVSNGNPTVDANHTLIPLTELSRAPAGAYDLDAGSAGAKTITFSHGAAQEASGVGASFGVAFGALFNLPVLDLLAEGTHLGALFALPKLALSADGGGGVGTLSANLPKLGLNAFGSGNIGIAQFNLPASGLHGTFLEGTSEFILPALAFTGSGHFSSLGTLDAVLPKLGLLAEGLDNGVGTASFLLPSVKLSAQGATGHAGTLVAVLPLLAMAGSGLHVGAGNAAFSLPILFLSAQGQATLAEVYRTWVLNTRKNALTEYDFQFNSYALFQGRVLAAGPNGIVVLGTETQDSAVAILARVRPAVTDFGNSHLKRIPRIYTGLKTDGDMLFRTFVTGAGPRTYRLPHNNVSGYQQRRVPIGKGPKSRYWQFEWQNEGGADFSIQNLLVHPTGLRRRVM